MHLGCRFSSMMLVGALLLQMACSSGESVRSRPLATAELREGAIIDTATGQVISQDQLMAQLSQQEILYLGEEHHNGFHIQAALTVLQRLMAGARQPILAMEMFGWDGQPALDRFLSSQPMSQDEFLDQARWKHNWGGAFEDYEPLVQYAKIQHLPLVAMNPPKALVRIVARQGLESARRSPELAEWNMQNEAIVDDQAYRERIFRQIKACHDGGADAVYQRMYEASLVRDEGMARTLALQVERVRLSNDPMVGPVVSYTGGGHVQYQLPVPKRVVRRLADPVRQRTVYLTAYDPTRVEEIREIVREGIADYVWLTSVGGNGPPHRCR